MGVVDRAAFSPDGTRIVTVDRAMLKSRVKVWDAPTGAPLVELKGQMDRV